MQYSSLNISSTDSIFTSTSKLTKLIWSISSLLKHPPTCSVWNSGVVGEAPKGFERIYFRLLLRFYPEDEGTIFFWIVGINLHTQHGDRSQKTVSLIFTAVRTPNPLLFFTVSRSVSLCMLQKRRWVLEWLQESLMEKRSSQFIVSKPTN
jgi:hypothetical protein